MIMYLRSFLPVFLAFALLSCNVPSADLERSKLGSDPALVESLHVVNRTVPGIPCSSLMLVAYKRESNGVGSSWFCEVQGKKYVVHIFVPADGSEPELLRTSAELEDNMPSGAVIDLRVEERQ
jgi:hypothetical protein